MEDFSECLQRFKVDQYQHLLKGHSHQVNSILLNRSENLLVSGSSDKTIIIWDTHKRKQIKKSGILKSSVSALLLFNNDESLAIGFKTGEISIHSFPNLEEEFTLNSHSMWISSLLEYNKLKIISSSWDCTIRVWEIAHRRLETILDSHISFVNSVALHGETLVSASNDKTLIFWEVGKRKTCKIVNCKAEITSIEICNKFSLILTGDSDGFVRKWDLKEVEINKELGKHEDLVSCVRLNWNQEELFSCSFDGSVMCWELNEGNLLFSFKLEFGLNQITCFRYANRAAVSGRNGRVAFLELEKNEAEISYLPGHIATIHRCEWVFKGKILICADFLGTVCMWDLENERAMSFSYNFKTEINDISYDRKENLLGVLCSDKRVFIIDTLLSVVVSVLTVLESPLKIFYFKDRGLVFIDNANDIVICDKKNDLKKIYNFTRTSITSYRVAKKYLVLVMSFSESHIVKLII